MYDLVADIERYAEFLPGCRGVVINSKSQLADAQIVEATMTVGHKMIVEKVMCRAKLDQEALKIDVSNLGGPLRHLENSWVFYPRDDGGCDVEFSIDFALKSRALSLVIGGLFDQVFGHMLTAFERRAAEIYE